MRRGAGGLDDAARALRRPGTGHPILDDVTHRSRYARSRPSHERYPSVVGLEEISRCFDGDITPMTVEVMNVRIQRLDNVKPVGPVLPVST